MIAGQTKSQECDVMYGHPKADSGSVSEAVRMLRWQEVGIIEYARDYYIGISTWHGAPS